MIKKHDEFITAQKVKKGDRNETKGPDEVEIRIGSNIFCNCIRCGPQKICSRLCLPYSNFRSSRDLLWVVSKLEF